MLRLPPVRVALASLPLLGGACVATSVHVAPVERSTRAAVISTPVKAHLLDGSTVVYRDSVRIRADTLWGDGERFSLTLDASSRASRIPLDSVAAMESFTTEVNQGKSTALTLAAIGGTIAVPVLLKAIFGSCPTVYSDSAGVPALEAEGFSYSIAPLFERRDVHRLHAGADASGVVRLEVRNEALETHYINHLELLEVTHDSDEVVLPDAHDHVLALRGLAAPGAATDRAGRDVLPMLRGRAPAFATDGRTLRRATAADPNDWIDLTILAPHADSLALVFDLRNSLLNTVLLYDVMLAGQGARSLDWEGRDLANIGYVVTLGRWYGGRMGMHVLLRRGAEWEKVAFVPDAGPIAWRQVAAMVPVPAGEDTLHVRLLFVADQWRIRGLRVASRARRVEPRAIPLARVETRGIADTAARRHLRDADALYLETTPGQRMGIEFDAGPAPSHGTRTFLLAMQGYYVEWVRRDWMRAAGATFTPGDGALATALHRWIAERADYERRFAATRIPVR